MSPFDRAPLIALALVAGAALAGLAFVDQPLLDAEQFRTRLERWRAMDEGDRQRLRERWRDFQALPEDSRHEVRRRFGALRRLERSDAPARPDRGPRARPPRPRGGFDRDSLHRRIGRVEALAREMIKDHARPDLRDEVRRKTLGRVRAFLDSLVRQGRIDVARRDELLALPVAHLLRESLALQKAEMISLYEGMERHEDLAELRTLDPVEVIERLRLQRKKEGLLGRAGRLLSLPDIRRERVAGALEQGEYEAVVEYLRPHVRELLERQGVAPDLVEETLRLPYAQLERRVDRILRKDEGRGRPGS